MDWLGALFVILCLGFLAWGLVAFVTQRVTGTRDWGDLPEPNSDDDPDWRDAVRRWEERERRKGKAVG